jgi:hypothetical protein
MLGLTNGRRGWPRQLTTGRADFGVILLPLFTVSFWWYCTLHDSERSMLTSHFGVFVLVPDEICLFSDFSTDEVYSDSRHNHPWISYPAWSHSLIPDTHVGGLQTQFAVYIKHEIIVLFSIDLFVSFLLFSLFSVVGDNIESQIWSAIIRLRNERQCCLRRCTNMRLKCWYVDVNTDSLPHFNINHGHLHHKRLLCASWIEDH